MTQVVMKGGLAIKLTLKAIENVIEYITYEVVIGSTTTICTIHLKNGAIVVGTNSCIHHDTWDAKMGETESLKMAMDKVYELEGYLLRQKLYEAGQL